MTLDKEGLKEVKGLPLRPLREMRKMKGTLKELLEKEAEDNYIQAILTDKGELIDPIGTLRSRYPNIMQIVREETGKAFVSGEVSQSRVLIKQRDILALFEAFYQEVRGQELSEEGKRVIAELIR